MRYYQEFPFFIGFIVLLLASLKVDAVDQNYINQLVPRMSTLDRESVVKNEYGYSLDEVIQELRERDNEYTAAGKGSAQCFMILLVLENGFGK